MLNNKIYMILTIMAVAGIVSAANITDVRTVTGTTAKTVDGSLAEWNSTERLITRPEFMEPGFAATSSWSESDSDVLTDIYASYSNYHLYIAVDMNSISVEEGTDDFGTTGVEVYLLVNKNRDDIYCWQAVAHYNTDFAQRIFLHNESGSVEANDVDAAASSFFDGAIVTAHEIDISPYEDRYFCAEFDFDLAKLGQQTGGFDLFNGDTVAIAIFARGQRAKRQGCIWGGDSTAGEVGWLPFQNTENDQQGFTGGFQLTLEAPSNCSQVQVSDKSASDIDGDCYVNLEDFAILAANWLGDCTNPNDSNCQD